MRNARLYSFLLAAAGAVCDSSVAQTVIAFQGFEDNSVALLESDGPEAPGALTTERQFVELRSTDDVFDAPLLSVDTPIFEFTQPTDTLTVIVDEVETMIPAPPTGRVFDAPSNNPSNRSIPWTLSWANSRSEDPDVILAEADAANDALLASFNLPPQDLIYLFPPEDGVTNMLGPVPGQEALDAGLPPIINASTLAVIVESPNIGGTGVTADAFDTFGVVDQRGIDEQDAFDVPAGQDPVLIPEGLQAFLADDPDGTLLLDLDPINVSGFSRLSLSFDIAVGDTGFEGFDRAAVEVNGVLLQELLGVDEADATLEEQPTQFTSTTLDLSSFDGEASLAIRFIFDGSAESEVIALDNIVVAGFANLAGDFNGDGAVDAADYTVWRDSLDQVVEPSTGADASGNGLVDQADFEVWVGSFGDSAVSAAAAVPEPASLLSVAAAFGLSVSGWRAGRRAPA